MDCGCNFDLSAVCSRAVNFLVQEVIRLGWVEEMREREALRGSSFKFHVVQVLGLAYIK